MTALARARETAATVRLHRAIGIAKRRRRIPRQRYPRTIELEYAKAILGVVAQARASLAPLLAALPRLIERAAAKRRIDDESSGGEGDETRRLIDQAREHMRQAIQPQALDDLARKFAGRTERDQGDQLKAQVRAGLGADVFLADRKLPALVDHFAAENVALIRGLPDDIAGQIEKLVTRALSSGTPHPELARQIEERFAVGESRARLIARDQIGKLYGQVNASRQQQLGITHAIWRTVHDERVRPEHAALDGELFALDDPPAEGLPGEAISCRCTADPSLDSILDEYDPPEVPSTNADLAVPRDFTVTPGEIDHRVSMPEAGIAAPDSPRMAYARESLRTGRAQPIRAVMNERGDIEITDGRHRYLAAKERNLPVKMRIERGAAMPKR